jgi:hypothetical protein
MVIGDWDWVCPNNIYHPSMRSAKYDSYACLKCNIWLDGVCSDPTCDYCKDKPEKPYQTKLLGDVSSDPLSPGLPCQGKG